MLTYTKRLDWLCLSRAICLGTLAILGSPVAATSSLQHLKSLTLEDLGQIEVSLLGKRPGRVSDTAAAVFVITADDIRRSTATRLPELLRMVPGFNVARQDNSEWAISARGFNSRYANKLLVMIDGRSVYSPIISGTLWEAQDPILEDIERIEVIRGPGAATWGANAVNGVINIITRSAGDTQGTLATGLLGTEQNGAWVRQGGRVGGNDDISYRAYAKYYDRDPFTRTDGSPNNDEWSGGRAGFRTDWRAGSGDHLTLQGDIFEEDADNPLLSGGNLLARWDHESAGDHDTLQIYYDRSNIETGGVGHEQLHTIDLDYSRQLAANGAHAVSFGAGYRFMHSRFRPSDFTTVRTGSRDIHHFSTFLQDDITLLPDELTLTLGAKFEHNPFSGLEFQPSARVAWQVTADSSLWGAVSRVTRAPARGEHDVAYGAPVGTFLGLPLVNMVGGNESFDSEQLTAYELGFRTQAGERLNVDVALFYNDYDRLRSIELQPGLPVLAAGGTHYLTASPLDNLLYGESYGIEIATDWRPVDRWRLRAAYSYINMQLHKRPGSVDSVLLSEEGRTPQHQLALHSAFDIDARTEFDVSTYYADHQPTTGTPSYVNLDLRLGYRISKQLRVDIGGRNLLDPHHPEIGPDPLTAAPEQVDREVFIKLTWQD